MECINRLFLTQFDFYWLNAIVFVKNDRGFQNPPLFFVVLYEKCEKKKYETNVKPRFSIPKFDEYSCLNALNWNLTQNKCIRIEIVEKLAP